MENEGGGCLTVVRVRQGTTRRVAAAVSLTKRLGLGGVVNPNCNLK